MYGLPDGRCKFWQIFHLNKCSSNIVVTGDLNTDLIVEKNHIFNTLIKISLYRKYNARTKTESIRLLPMIHY